MNFSLVIWTQVDVLALQHIHLEKEFLFVLALAVASERDVQLSINYSLYAAAYSECWPAEEDN